MPLRPQRQQAFTLIEVLAATAVAAILMSAISLNLGIRDNLFKFATDGLPQSELQVHIDEVLNTKTISQLNDYIDIPASDSDLSDPTSSSPRKLVAVTIEALGSGAEQVEVLAIEVRSGSTSLTRWLTPSDR